jgi:hypothetical protein
MSTRRMRKMTMTWIGKMQTTNDDGFDREDEDDDENDFDEEDVDDDAADFEEGDDESE